MPPSGLFRRPAARFLAALVARELEPLDAPVRDGRDLEAHLERGGLRMRLEPGGRGAPDATALLSVDGGHAAAVRLAGSLLHLHEHEATATPGDQIELVHDRLAAVALQRAQATQRQTEAAERLRREKEAAELEVLKQQARAAEMAQERARIEQARADDAVRSTRRARRLMAAVALIGVVAVAAALFAMNRSRLAASEKQAAESARLLAESARIDAEAKADQAEKALAAAKSTLEAVAKV